MKKIIKFLKDSWKIQSKYQKSSFYMSMLSLIISIIALLAKLFK